MTINDRAMVSEEKNLAKLAERIEKAENRLSKKLERCIKLKCNWSLEERRAKAEADITDKQEEAWFTKRCAERELEDLRKSLERANKRYVAICEKVTAEHEANEAFKAELNRADTIEVSLDFSRPDVMWKIYLRQLQEELGKDGITVTYAREWGLTGNTAKGKAFSITRNEGYTVRSRHCYTLKINGNVIFTSGEFWRCLNLVKSN